MFQEQIFEEATHNPLLRLAVAMEAALSDGRYDEAAKARDEFRKALKEPPLPSMSSQQASQEFTENKYF